jgi:hypothetical protein
MQLIANLQEQRQEEVNHIWQLIVDYVNGDGTTKQFEKLAAQCFARLGMEDAPRMLRQCEDIKAGKSLTELAEHYRSPLRDVLRWINSPKTFSMMDAEEFVPASMLNRDAANFLMEHARSLRVTLEAQLVLNKTREDATILLRRVFSELGSVVTGICRFILDQVDQHDLDGVPLAEVFPFGLCEREGCGRFFYVKRIGRGKFCSGNCRAAVAKAKKPLEEKAAYMKDYRALKAKQAKRAGRKTATKGRGK